MEHTPDYNIKQPNKHNKKYNMANTKKKVLGNFITKEIDINTNPGKVWQMANTMLVKYSKKKGIGDMINDNNVK